MGKLRRALIPLAILLNALGCWTHWEAVVMESVAERRWEVYLFYVPVFFWHVLGYLLIVIGTLILGYYTIKNCEKEYIK